ncbi:Uncharacterized protein C12orf50-like [Cricetulus griseus]|uniref:Uncharacterized protein C12orf50-like n=1 Tax=Cricetulus griseus TaxID=10029 RepID=G3HII5_CRIGR|nr:Uncharacterized protein C12orf50-like [Cricetulus griseus]
MENVSRPIHNPLVLKTNFEEEEEEEEEQNDASSLWTKTPEEIEEKRAIKEMCYKSGEYYRFHAPPDVSSSKSVAPTVEKELEKPLENGSELQEGDGLTVPTKFSLFERPGEAKTSLDRKPRTDIAAFENGGGDCYAPQRIIFLGVNESEALAEVKDITSKCSNVKAGHTPNPKHKMSYHHHNKNRNAENASYMHVQRDSVRTVTLNTPPRSRPTSGPYNKDDVNKEPKLNLCPDKHMPTSYNGSAWRRRIPFSKTYSKTEKIYPGKYLLVTFNVPCSPRNKLQVLRSRNRF